VLVAAFVILLQHPMLGSPSWLPLLGVGWLGAFGFTMTLQATLPLPDVQQ
jgi:hypothetical protein